MSHFYTCEECGETFEAEWSDEEAQAEARALFPGVPQEDMAVVCDDCWQGIMGLGKEAS